MREKKLKNRTIPIGIPLSLKGDWKDKAELICAPIYFHPTPFETLGSVQVWIRFAILQYSEKCMSKQPKLKITVSPSAPIFKILAHVLLNWGGTVPIWTVVKNSFPDHEITLEQPDDMDRPDTELGKIKISINGCECLTVKERG